MIPKEFAEKMKMLKKEYEKNGDQEATHKMMDNLMCELLKELGYDEGVKIFEEQGKWYA
jgi:hypothetical protein